MNDKEIVVSVGNFDYIIEHHPFLKNDSHPNLEAHKYRSTIIENFLRSL